MARAAAIALATITGNLALVAGSVIFGLLALLASAVPPRGDLTYRVARLWARVLLAASFVRVRSHLASLLPADGRFVLMANHQSLYDIPALLVAWPGQARFMAKQSLFRIPVFGWALRAGGFIPVDRRNPAQAPEAFAAAAAHLAGGTSVVLFPEQMRSRDGRLLAFQRGGFLLALKSRLPILPVGLAGTRAVQRRGSLLVRPGVVEVRFGTPVETAGRSVREVRIGGELVAEIRGTIAALAGVAAADDAVARPAAADPGSGPADG